MNYPFKTICCIISSPCHLCNLEYDKVEIPKRQYYYVSEKGRRLFELALGPLALSFVGVSDKEAVAVIKQHETKYGDGWVEKWLKSRGLTLNQYLEAA